MGYLIGDASLGGTAAKTVRMADDPVGHKAAIGTTGYTHALFVNLWIAGDAFVRKLHNIFVINGTVLSDYIGKHIVPALAASGITVDNKIAMVSPVLQLMVKNWAIGALRAAMNVQYGRILLGGIKVYGLQDPPLQLKPVVFKCNQLRCAYGALLAHPVFKMSHLTKLTIL